MNPGADYHVRRIEKGLLRGNPFNPKHPFSVDEREALQASLDKWGMAGTLLVCCHPEETGAFIILDGNSRVELIQDDEPLCFVLDSIKTMEELKEFTVEYCAAVKKRNFTDLYKLWNEKKYHIDSKISKLFENVNAAEIGNVVQEKAQNVSGFSRVVLMNFKNQDAFDTFQALRSKLEKKLGTDQKLQSFIEQNIGMLGQDWVQKYFFDIVLSGGNDK